MNNELESSLLIKILFSFIFLPCKTLMNYTQKILNKLWRSRFSGHVSVVVHKPSFWAIFALEKSWCKRTDFCSQKISIFFGLEMVDSR